MTAPNSTQFTVRDKASRELRKLSETAEPAMRKVLDGKPSVELRRRVEALLELQADWLPEDLRALRAIEALEHMDGPDAEKLLKALAAGSPDARLTREAKASLKSMGRRYVALGKAEAQEGKEGKRENVAGEWVSLFNGKDFAGWEGLTGAEGYWSVNDKALIGVTPNALGFNTFLCSKQKFKDFELQFQVKLSKGATAACRYAVISTTRRPLRSPARNATWADRTGAASTAKTSAA